jgi:hypothetical protein
VYSNKATQKTMYKNWNWVEVTDKSQLTDARYASQIINTN